MPKNRPLVLCSLLLCALCGCPNSNVNPDLASTADLTTPPQGVTIQVLSISDWHGQLDPLTVNGADVGGAAVLSAYFKQERAAQPNTLTLTAGDAFGATPPLSAFNNDEPAVKALNLMGLDADTFGNHNFDYGIAPLQHLISLATYQFTSANLANVTTTLPAVASPFYMKTVAGFKVALVGITNDDAPSLIKPGNMGPITVQNSATSANAAAQQARAAGADLVIAMVHMGATLVTKVGTQDVPSGPIVDFAKAVHGFDLILGDHTNLQVNTTINNTPVVENLSFGQTYARIRLTLDPVSRQVMDRKAEILTPYRCQPGGDGGCAPAVTPDPAIDALLKPYRDQLNAAYDAKIGVASGLFVRGNNIERVQEVPIGDLLADAVRQRYGVKVVVLNSGGIRAPLPSAYLPADHTLRRTSAGYAAGPPYDLVIGDVYAVLPFGNLVVTRTVTGQMLWAIMEHSVSSLPAPVGGFLQVSGIKVRYNSMNAAGMRVSAITLDDGTAVPKDGTVFTFATSDFTNAGGDGYTMLADGQGVSRDKLDQVLLDAIKAAGTITPMTSGRLVDMP